MTATDRHGLSGLGGLGGLDAAGIAAAVRGGEISATAVVEATLARIAATDDGIHAFTEVTRGQALRRAGQIDASLQSSAAQRTRELPLLGVPFAVKNLIDIAGITTTAGARIERDTAPANADATVVKRLERAGAVLIGALNADEYGCGFTTENREFGTTRNPHDPACLAGGSSGGSAAALAAGQVPLTLGTDTNGSIRVPASLCGVYGLKPTFGRLPRTGIQPFVSSLDHVGPLARSVTDLALAYDVLQGPESPSGPHDPGCAQRAVEAAAPTLDRGIRDLKIGVLTGWFRRWADDDALTAVDLVAQALGARQAVEWPLAEAGRAVASLITRSEAASLHLEHLRRRVWDLEPATRDRLFAGALLPAPWVATARQVRRRFAEEAARVFRRHDVLLAPATPCAAPVVEPTAIELDGQRLPLRDSLGLLTSPLSCLGLPVCTVPVWGAHPRLPIGVQLVAAPWCEDRVLRVAAELERAGLCYAPVA